MERIGHTELAQTLVRAVRRIRPPAPPTPQTKQFLAAIEAAQPHNPNTELAFLARQLVQVTLPHRAPPPDKPFVRTNGNLSLVIVSGANGKGKVLGIPFGSIPRLLLAFINAEVVRTKSRRVELGDSLTAFCRAVGFTPSNGSQTRRLREQMRRLFAASITFHETRQIGNFEVDRTLHLPVTSKSELWWNSKCPDERSMFGSSFIVLSEYFHEAILAAPVPLNLRALRALKRSPLALDLYAWLNYRTFTTKKPTFVTWKQISEQFGTDYTTTKNFKQKTKSALRKVRAVSPNLNVKSINGGLLLSPSPPTIASTTN